MFMLAPFNGQYLRAQSLSTGDIAFLGFNSDNPDQFSFILMTYLESLDTIYFTDCGYTGSGFYKNEGHFKWAPPAAGLAGGTIVTITASGAGFTNSSSLVSATATAGTCLSVIPKPNVSNTSMELNNDGDQIIAYKGPPSSPTYIACLNFNDSFVWSASSSSEFTALPPGLTNGVNAVAMSDLDNSIVNCNLLSATPTVSEFNTVGNWAGLNDPRWPLPPPVSCVYTLPIELGNFYAVQQGMNVLLQWSTLTEINNNIFLIQRSTGGYDFTIIGSVKGAGNSDQQVTYTFTDTEPANGLNYYRLQQVDNDGSMTQSAVISTDFAYSQNSEMPVYPNPAADRIFFRQPLSSEALITIRDITGNIVLQATDPANGIAIDGLLPGIYTIQVNGAGDLQQQSFVKL